MGGLSVDFEAHTIGSLGLHLNQSYTVSVSMSLWRNNIQAHTSGNMVKVLVEKLEVFMLATVKEVQRNNSNIHHSKASRCRRKMGLTL